MRPTTIRRFCFLLALAAVLGFVASTGERGAAVAETPPAPQAPMPVTVRTLTKQPVRMWSEYSGHLQAVDYAEIRPQVGGRILEIRFKDGQYVRKGEVLFVIDPRPFEAALAKAEANAAFATQELQRATKLVQNRVIAKRLLDERRNADLAAQAELKQARLNLEYAFVKAPIAGRISRAEITVGNLVETNMGAPILTSIVSDGAIYADFEVDEKTYLRFARTDNPQKQAIPVEMMVGEEKDHPIKGSIHSFDNRINPTTGTIRARAKFTNTDDALVPGMFVTLRLGSGAMMPALLVPERAISNDQDKKVAYIVGEGNKVAYREVRLGEAVGKDRVVLSGLQEGDKLIVEGILRLQPDMPVTPQEQETGK